LTITEGSADTFVVSNNYHSSPRTEEPMPSSIGTAHEGKDKEAAKKHAVDCGGEIAHEYSIVNGFAVTFPEGHVHTLDSHPDVEAVEPDGEV
jgi:hypothetical protein